MIKINSLTLIELGVMSYLVAKLVTTKPNKKDRK